MVSAISFGVFCRDAPSTSAIILSRKLSPGCVVTFTLILSDKTFVPPVTLERSPPASRITGADSPVIALSSMVAMPSMISPSDGMMSPASHTKTSPFCKLEELRVTILPSSKTLAGVLFACLAKRVSLCFTARFGKGFGEVGKQHRRQQYNKYSDVVCGRSLVCIRERINRDAKHDQCTDFNTEHYGVFHHLLRIEFHESIFDGSLNQRRLEQTNFGFDFFTHKEKYSAIGPSVSAGKNDSAAMMMITHNNTALNATLSTLSVPALSGMYFFDASEPAIANGPMIGMNLASNITKPHMIFQNGVLSLSPSKPDPLFR